MERGRKLSALRKQRGLSQQALAKELYVTRQSVSGWECGASVPTLDNLMRMAKLFGVPLEALLDDDAPLPEPDGAVPAAARAEMPQEAAPEPERETPPGAPEPEPEEETPPEAPESEPPKETLPEPQRENLWWKCAVRAAVAVCLLLTAAAAAVYLWRTFSPAPEDDIVWQEDMLPEIIGSEETVHIPQEKSGLSTSERTENK